MNRFCPVAIPGCKSPFSGVTEEVDSPITNLSSEAPDGISFTSPAWPRYNPDGGIPPDSGNPAYYASDCWGIEHSSSSQIMADLAALVASVNCPCPDCGDDGTARMQFMNDEQTAFTTCTDGSLFWFKVPAGTFVSPLLNQEAGQAWKDAANAQALAYAQQQAAVMQNRSCINCPRLQGLPGWVCLNDELDPAANTYTLTGPNSAADYDWAIVSGSLPPGTSLVKTSHNSAEVVGVPTATGLYAYTVRASRIGMPFIFAEVADTFRVFGITNPHLPDATVGTAYDEQLTTGGASGAVAFTLMGTLPPGLSMDSTGHITGTPT